ncbi:helix-turn-helix transcriptional regulator [Bradyrhizobium manausense]|uniref:helix-turn-helix domain-containing protein n=1 Tax=Bradyrhizobium TaxID=374 RepID=UPI001BA581EB|nr:MULTISPECIES: helix-turn-helix domain-containing protein [Bradyrhizobium]MBR0830724.1 helix-turn-helix transcriptional regulator [Bradyrhizobium manausense]UVO28735.1 helix-turn-helix transcriptional regulator [Bradyrhizobium arachidis]
MAENGTLTFSEPDGYIAEFGDARINLTITGAGDFNARLTRLKLKHLEVYLACESLPRIAYISLPPEQVFLSFPVGTASLISDGFTLRNGDMFLHGRGESTHQRSDGACQWGFTSLSTKQFERCSKTLTGREIAPPHPSRVLHPARADVTRFQRLFKEACHLAEAKRRLIERPEVTRALEQEMLHAIINCVSANEARDNQTLHRHAAIMARFEETLRQRIDQKLNMPALCAEIGVPERTLRLCCAKFLGVSPTRYLLLRRLNKARSALRRADPSIATVAEVARDHQFLELGRFAVTYRTTFGESPSMTLHRDPQSEPAESA